MDLFPWLHGEDGPRDDARRIGSSRSAAGHTDRSAVPGNRPQVADAPPAAGRETEPDHERGPLRHPPTVPRPVTLDRLCSWCRDHGYLYFVDSDGDLGGFWRGRQFFFFLHGPESAVLQVRGYWNRECALERLSEVLELCNAWHIQRIWPTCYAEVRDNGMVHVSCEVTADVGHGATDAQLDRMLQCGLGAGTAFFDQLDLAYPDPVRQAP